MRVSLIGQLRQLRFGKRTWFTYTTFPCVYHFDFHVAFHERLTNIFCLTVVDAKAHVKQDPGTIILPQHRLGRTSEDIGEQGSQGCRRAAPLPQASSKASISLVPWSEMLPPSSDT
ncbi:hypothetical protein R3P38DRAFT_3346572 [Favolaschia claudopus]|uniref:Uncharacterized protein n=1 Tax=Favolaschia claudopus TaxID=2862362 RepID=A0AAW0D6J3_9AGAR